MTKIKDDEDDVCQLDERKRECQTDVKADPCLGLSNTTCEGAG